MDEELFKLLKFRASRLGIEIGDKLVTNSGLLALELYPKLPGRLALGVGMEEIYGQVIGENSL